MGFVIFIVSDTFTGIFALVLLPLLIARKYKTSKFSVPEKYEVWRTAMIKAMIANILMALSGIGACISLVMISNGSATVNLGYFFAVLWGIVSFVYSGLKNKANKILLAESEAAK
ncbi:MAG: hypothetical protein PHO32_07980 [Candidatus Cloacimonetes bacterium]|nr:hypothetical protein [Candidatus Cloacimonadota bacterium]